MKLMVVLGNVCGILIGIHYPNKTGNVTVGASLGSGIKMDGRAGRCERRIECDDDGKVYKTVEWIHVPSIP